MEILRNTKNLIPSPRDTMRFHVRNAPLVIFHCRYFGYVSARHEPDSLAIFSPNLVAWMTSPFPAPNPYSVIDIGRQWNRVKSNPRYIKTIQIRKTGNTPPVPYCRDASGECQKTQETPPRDGYLIHNNELHLPNNQVRASPRRPVVGLSQAND